MGDCGDGALTGVDICVHTPSLPVGAGLGSSAAFSVSTAAALLDALAHLQGAGSGLFGGEAGDDRGSKAPAAAAAAVVSAIAREAGGGNCDGDGDSAGSSHHMAMPTSAAVLASINDWAYCAEMLFHGTPSGLDNTVAT